MNKNFDGDEFCTLLDQLNAKNKNDVLDITAFIVWKQTKKTLPFFVWFRGACKFFVFEVSRRFQN